MDEKKKQKDVNLVNENEEVERIIEELEEAKGIVYRQAMSEKAVVTFTLGILGIVFIGLFKFAAPAIGAVGIVVGISARADAKKSVYGGNGMATVGLVCSVVALVVSIIILFCHFGAAII